MANLPTVTVHFSSIPEIVEIPRRSLWRRKVKPLKDRCCSICYTISYFLCYPLVEFVRFCAALCNLWKGDDSDTEVRRNRSQRRDSHSLYVQSIAGQGLIYGPYASHSGSNIKQAPQFL